LSFAAAIAAQTPQYAVSPIRNLNAVGTGSNAFPFTNSTPQRFLQIHSDLPTVPMFITALSFRHSSGSGNFTGSTLTCDVEMWMGASVPYDRFSYYYEKNYLPNARKQVVARRQIVWNGGIQGSPSPFAHTLPLDAPILRLPLDHWAW